MVKIIYLTGIFLMLTLNIMSQETVSIPQKQRAAATYITDTIDNEIFIYRNGVPFDSTAPSSIELIVKYKLWPNRTLVNKKDYIQKYLLPYIQGSITTKDCYITLSLYYELCSGELKWIMISFDKSIKIPVRQIEHFEKAMIKNDKAFFNKDSKNIQHVKYFIDFDIYDLYELKHQTDDDISYLWDIPCKLCNFFFN